MAGCSEVERDVVGEVDSEQVGDERGEADEYLCDIRAIQFVYTGELSLYPSLVLADTRGIVESSGAVKPALYVAARGAAVAVDEISVVTGQDIESSISANLLAGLSAWQEVGQAAAGGIVKVEGLPLVATGAKISTSVADYVGASYDLGAVLASD